MSEMGMSIALLQEAISFFFLVNQEAITNPTSNGKLCLFLFFFFFFFFIMKIFQNKNSFIVIRGNLLADTPICNLKKRIDFDLNIIKEKICHFTWLSSLHLDLVRFFENYSVENRGVQKHIF